MADTLSMFDEKVNKLIKEVIIWDIRISLVPLIEIGNKEKLAGKNEWVRFYFGRVLMNVSAEGRDEKAEYTVGVTVLNIWKKVMVGYRDFRMITVETIVELCEQETSVRETHKKRRRGLNAEAWQSGSGAKESTEEPEARKRLRRNCQCKRRAVSRELRKTKDFWRIGGLVHTPVRKQNTQLINLGSTNGQQIYEQEFYFIINLKNTMRYHFILLQNNHVGMKGKMRIRFSTGWALALPIATKSPGAAAFALICKSFLTPPCLLTVHTFYSISVLYGVFYQPCESIYFSRSPLSTPSTPSPTRSNVTTLIPVQVTII